MAMTNILRNFGVVTTISNGVCTTLPPLSTASQITKDKVKEKLTNTVSKITIPDEVEKQIEEAGKQNEVNKDFSKIIVKSNKKLHFANKLLDKLNNNGSDNPEDTKKAIINICNEVKNMLSGINVADGNTKFISELLDEANKLSKAADGFIINPQQQPQPEANPKEQQVQPKKVQQQTVAHNNGYGFNIANFMQPQQQQVQMHVVQPTQQQPKQTKSAVFPHEICGLIQDQIAAEVSKHFKLIPKENRNYTMSADALYDLANNKLLARKMKELDCKQRPNNPYLTQVDINEYIGEPELLAKYPWAFTMPCNDKKKLIMVLFNPNPVMDKNGVLQYPLHIFKATKTGAGKNDNANK